MIARFSNSYLEELFAQRDVDTLYQVISVVSDQRDLPEQFWLFCRLLEWSGSTRSGVWQYYECLPDEVFERMGHLLDQFALSEYAEQYRQGRLSWNQPTRAANLDRWLDDREFQTLSAAFQLIAAEIDQLKNKDYVIQLLDRMANPHGVTHNQGCERAPDPKINPSDKLP